MPELKCTCGRLRHPIYGAARKVALTFFVFSTLGWTIFFVFFVLIASETNLNTSNCVIQKSRLDGVFTPHWCFLITGPILYTCGVVALLVNREGYIQMTINFFVGLFFVSGGAIVYTDWILHSGELKHLFELGACITSLVTIVLYTIMVPHFKSLSNLVQEQGNFQLSNVNTVDPDMPDTEDKPVHIQQALESNTGVNSDQRKITSNQTSFPIDTGEEKSNNTQDEYALPNEIITTANDEEDEGDYVVNEPFYEDCHEGEHTDEVYEEMQEIIYDN